jgi:hypothetical protein
MTRQQRTKTRRLQGTEAPGEDPVTGWPEGASKGRSARDELPTVPYP